MDQLAHKLQNIARGTYRFALRAQGRYMLLLAAASAVTLPVFQTGQFFGAQLLFTLLGIAVGFLLVQPKWQPAFLRAPNGFLKSSGAMLASSLIFLIAMIVGYSAIIHMGLQEPLSKNLAMLTVLPSLVLTGVMWWSAAVLVTDRSGGGTPPASRAGLRNRTDMRTA